MAQGETGHRCTVDRTLPHCLELFSVESKTAECKFHFQVNDGVETETHGAWIWGTNTFRMASGDMNEGSLLLIDTQGLAKGKAEGLSRLFTVVTLASSVMVLNVMRHLNHDAIDKLEVSSLLAEHTSCVDSACLII